MNDQLRLALEVLDGRDRAGRDTPSQPGFVWTPRGHRLCLDAAQIGPLARAARAELAIFGNGAFAFGVGVRLFDADFRGPENN